MRKLLSLLILLSFMMLSACSSASNTENSPTEAPEPTVETVVETVVESVDTPTTSVEVQSTDVYCVAQPLAEDFSLENDWIEGVEEDFSVTIIEYGDFQ